MTEIKEFKEKSQERQQDKKYYFVAKEIYMYFKNKYDSNNWVLSYPPWERLSENTQKFWNELADLSYIKISINKNFYIKGRDCDKANQSKVV